MAPITVAIAAQAHRRASCRRLLEREDGIALLGEARPGPESVAALARLRPRVLLLDFARTRLDTLARLAEIRRRTPRTKVILLTTRQTSDALILEALHRGARGYLDAAAAPAFLAKAVRAVHAGEAWVPRRMGPKIHDRVTRLAAAEQKARRGRAGATRAARSSRQAWRRGAAS